VQVFATPSAPSAAVTFSDPAMHAINALAPGPGKTLVATDGSTARPYGQWVHDLMERGRSGRVLVLDLASGSIRTAASGLRYAFGVCAAGSELFVSESWRHRVIALSADGSPRTVLEHLPVYPSRLSPASSGGFWLTAFAARTQLVEFVLRESAYRRRMMAEIDPEYWIAPKLKSGQSFLEPMQGAHIKTMGVVKPWAPPRSYGLGHPARCGRRAALRAAFQGRRRQPWRRGGRRDGRRAVRHRQGAGPAVADAACRYRAGVARMSDIILALRKATKLYAGVPAIENVDFELRRGEIHALVGENGAGKSTLTKVMAGVVALTSGTMEVDGVEATPRTPLEARHLGIAMVFQENSLVPTMTVAQNLGFGLKMRGMRETGRSSASHRGRSDPRAGNAT